MAETLPETQAIYPKLINSKNGSWVEMHDEAGFAGYDPSDAQIAEAYVNSLGHNPETEAELGALAQISVKTRNHHLGLVDTAFHEIDSDGGWITAKSRLLDNKKYWGFIKAFIPLCDPSIDMKMNDDIKTIRRQVFTWPGAYYRQQDYLHARAVRRIDSLPPKSE